MGRENRFFGQPLLLQCAEEYGTSSSNHAWNAGFAARGAGLRGLPGQDEVRNIASGLRVLQTRCPAAPGRQVSIIVLRHKDDVVSSS